MIDLTAERRKRRGVETEQAPCCGMGRMTDAEFEAQSERVESLIRSLLPTMGLANYQTTISLVPGLIDGEGTVMMVSSDWRYEWLDIVASIERCAQESDSELTYDVLHEGTHAHLALMRADEPTQEQRDHEELVATRIGRMALAFGNRCAKQVREECEAAIDEKDKEIASLKRKLGKLEKAAA